MQTLSAKQAADTLGCSLSEVYRLWRLGTLIGYRVGNRYRISVASVQAMQAATNEKPPAEVRREVPVKPKSNAKPPKGGFIFLPPSS